MALPTPDRVDAGVTSDLHEPRREPAFEVIGVEAPEASDERFLGDVFGERVVTEEVPQVAQHVPVTGAHERVIRSDLAFLGGSDDPRIGFGHVVFATVLHSFGNITMADRSVVVSARTLHFVAVAVDGPSRRVARAHVHRAGDRVLLCDDELAWVERHDALDHRDEQPPVGGVEP